MPQTHQANLSLFFGHFHPLLVHLPIGFLALLAIVEVARRLRWFKNVAHARTLILLMTVLASIVTVTCGLLLASGGGYDANLLFWHKWLGIALASSCLLTAIAFWTGRPKAYAALLILSLLVLAPASHLGGSMTHGKDYLTEYAPQWVRSFLGDKPRQDNPKLIAAIPVASDPGQTIVFTDLVQPILAQNCISCHNGDKLRGKLRLDNWEGLNKGGDSGPCLIAGASKRSLLMQRMQLPADDDDHMPPAGKPQPTQDQIELVAWWIDAGASQQKRLGDLSPPQLIMQIATGLLGVAAPVATPAAPTVVESPPQPLDQLQPQIDHLSQSLGVIITQISADQPFLDVNASRSKAFGDSELAQLALLARNIASLNLAGTHVTEQGMQIVGSMANLQRLRIERTSITDAGLLPLAGLKKLNYLNLHSTAVTSAGLKALSEIPSLQHLYLWQTHVDPAAAIAFASAHSDPARINQIKQQIALLQAQLRSQTIEVDQGTALKAPTSTVPSTAPATNPIALKDTNP